MEAAMREEPAESFDVNEVEYAPEKGADIRGATTDQVRDYLQQIGRVPLLKAEEEVELSRRIEAGLFAAHLLETGETGRHEKTDLAQIAADGMAAKNHMLAANQRLVVDLSKRYRGRGLDFLDLIQEGNLGLIRAVEKFDYTRGYKFSTYATWWIRQAITRGLSEHSRTIRVPVHYADLISKYRQAQHHMRRDLLREPTDKELADTLHMSLDKISEIKDTIRQEPLSLNKLIGDSAAGRGETSTEMQDLIHDVGALDPAEAAMHQVLYDQLRPTIMRELERACANDRDVTIMMLRYGLDDGRPKSLDEVGNEVGLTRERIRQIVISTQKKLQRSRALRGLRRALDD